VPWGIELCLPSLSSTSGKIITSTVDRAILENFLTDQIVTIFWDCEVQTQSSGLLIFTVTMVAKLLVFKTNHGDHDVIFMSWQAHRPNQIRISKCFFPVRPQSTDGWVEHHQRLCNIKAKIYFLFKLKYDRLPRMFHQDQTMPKMVKAAQDIYICNRVHVRILTCLRKIHGNVTSY
jgi:hypothetical protein